MWAKTAKCNDQAKSWYWELTHVEKNIENYIQLLHCGPKLLMLGGIITFFFSKTYLTFKWLEDQTKVCYCTPYSACSLPSWAASLF